MLAMSELLTAEHQPPIYLNPFDSIDNIIIVERETHVNFLDRLPTASQLRGELPSIQKGDEAAVKKLMQDHKLLIAVVGFIFKDPRISSDELLITSSAELLGAAQTYSSSEVTDFHDHAITSISQKLKEKNPRASNIFDHAEYSPMERLFQLMVQLETAPEISPEQKEILNLLSPLQGAMLPLLHLPYEEIAVSLNTTPKTVSNAMRRIRQKIGFNFP